MSRRRDDDDYSDVESSYSTDVSSGGYSDYDSQASGESDAYSSYTDGSSYSGESSNYSEGSYSGSYGSGSQGRGRRSGREFMKQSHRQRYDAYSQHRQNQGFRPVMTPRGMMMVGNMNNTQGGTSTGVSLASPQRRAQQMMGGNGGGGGGDRYRGHNAQNQQRTSSSITAQGLVMQLRQGQPLLQNVYGQQQQPIGRGLPNALANMPPIGKFNARSLITPINITVLGGANTGKTTVLHNLAAELSYRFDACFVMTPNSTTFAEFRSRLPVHWVHNEFNESICQKIIFECEKIRSTGHMPAVNIILDDVYADDSEATKSPSLLKMDKRSRHFGVSKFESTHSYTDKSAKSRTAMPIIGIMCNASSALVKDAYNLYFKGFGYKTLLQFETHLHQLGGKGSCLFAVDGKLQMYHARRVEELRPFTIGHPDAYMILHYYSDIKVSDLRVPRDPAFMQGLKGAPAFARAHKVEEERAMEDQLRKQREQEQNAYVYVEVAEDD